MAKRLVSGIQPTGELHLGNYLGAIKQWVELQHDYDCFFFIVDYHALTTRPQPDKLHEATLHAAAMLVALGIDPKSAPIFLQSDISAHPELGWIFNNFTTMGQLSRMTQYKEKRNQFGQTVGLFTYPTLMAADILLYNPEVVPVGEDQVQHLELTREIARTFNHHVGEAVFKEPKPILNKAARVMSLADPTKKMSKSSPSGAIMLLDDAPTVERAIKRAVTDSDPNSKEMSPAIKNLFAILEGVSEPETVQHFERQYQEGTIRYSELKDQLIDDVLAFLGPIQKTYQSLRSDEAQLLKILEEGRKAAQPVGHTTLQKAKKKLGLI